MRLACFLVAFALLAGCLGNGPDTLYVQNKTDAPLSASVEVWEGGRLAWRENVTVPAGEFVKRDVLRGDGHYNVTVSLSDGRAANASVRLAYGAEFLQVFIERDAIHVATMHGD